MRCAYGGGPPTPCRVSRVAMRLRRGTADMPGESCGDALTAGDRRLHAGLSWCRVGEALRRRTADSTPGCLRSVDSAVPGRNADLLRVGKALTAEDRRLQAGLSWCRAGRGAYGGGADSKPGCPGAVWAMRLRRGTADSIPRFAQRPGPVSRERTQRTQKIDCLCDPCVLLRQKR